MKKRKFRKKKNQNKWMKVSKLRDWLRLKKIKDQIMGPLTNSPISITYHPILCSSTTESRKPWKNKKLIQQLKTI